MKKFSYFLVALLVFSIETFSQDVHFSQWWMSDGFVMPSTIHSENNLFVQAGIKSQWQGVSGVPFQLQHGDLSFALSKQPHFSFHTSFLKDKSGDGSWVQNKMYVGLGYWHSFDSSRFVLKGVMQYRWSSAHWNNESWQFMDEWNGVNRDEQLGQDEYFSRSSANGFSMSLSCLLNASKKLSFQMGYSFFSKMNYTFKNGQSLYQWDNQQMIGLNAKVNDLELHPYNIQSFFQKQSQQNVKLLYVERGSVIDPRKWMRSTLWLGAGWRNNDALILGVGYAWSGHLFRMTYDLNLSSFKVATEYRGGWELHYQFSFLKPKLLKRNHIQCPQYY